MMHRQQVLRQSPGAPLFLPLTTEPAQMELTLSPDCLTQDV
jgi:hypothetical protein